MPSKYSKESIPTPKNGKVEIKSVEAHTLAALSFRCVVHQIVRCEQAST